LSIVPISTTWRRRRRRWRRPHVSMARALAIWIIAHWLVFDQNILSFFFLSVLFFGYRRAFNLYFEVKYAVL